jgi:prepilin-type N-terminal cleavage/methylation domain-containing protein
MSTLTDRFLLRLHGRMRSEGGFTLIELMVALGVVLVALVAMAYLATVGFTDIALARQRQGANGLANQTMEQIRALPFDTLKKGLANTDLNGDANITKNGPCAGTGTWYCYAGEQIPRGTNPNVVPLVPHTQTITVGKTTYTVRAYVTWYNNVTTSNTFRLTVLVTWPNAARQGVSSSVQTQSIAYSGAGCLSTKTHPFAAPCQPFFYGNATAGQGHFDVTGAIEGIQLETASLLLTGESSNAQVEQIAAVQGISTASGASLTLNGQAAQVSGGQQATSGADNDPAQPGQEYDSVLATGSGGALLASSGGGSPNLVTLTPSTSDPLATTSTTSASLVNPIHLCPLFGISENDLQACGSSTAQQVGTASSTLALNKSLSLGTTTLVSALAPPSAGSSFVNRQLQTGADGLIHSDVVRPMGTVTLASLPSGLDPAAVPVGWAGYLVQISGVTETVTAETGTNSPAPTVAAAGTIRYWNGIGYSTVAVAPGNSINLPVASVHILTLVGGKILQIDVQGSSVDCNVWALGCPTTGGTSTSETLQTCSPVPCPNTRSSATAQAGSPFLGDLHYTVTYNGSVLANLTIHVDFGSLLAQNTYQVAPSAV